MTALSRRDFARLVAAAAPFAMWGPASAGLTLGARLSAAGQIAFGVTTASFSDLARVEGEDNVADVIRAVQAVKVRQIELALASVEPGPPNTAPFIGGSAAYPVRIVPTPAQVAASNRYHREQVRAWRGEPSTMAHVEKAGAAFAAAGISVHACALAYDESFTDAEIDATMNHARALGANAVSSPLTLAMAARLAPFAERHRLDVAIHNQVDGTGAAAIATAELGKALALSTRFKLKLDIGHVTASNGDPVAVLRAHERRVSHVVLKDRLRNGGASQHFGEGDTPIAGVLGALKASPATIPAFVEYDYVGLQSSTDEVAAALAYLTKTLE